MESIEINEFKNLENGENLNQLAVLSEISDGLDYEILGDKRFLHILIILT